MWDLYQNLKKEQIKINSIKLMRIKVDKIFNFCCYHWHVGICSVSNLITNVTLWQWGGLFDKYLDI